MDCSEESAEHFSRFFFPCSMGFHAYFMNIMNMCKVRKILEEGLFYISQFGF